MRKATREIRASVGSKARYLVVLAAFGVLALALSACGGSGGGEASAASASAEPVVENVRIEIKSDTEHGKKGPEGTWHDAFLPADFSVKAGATVHVTVYNYDDMGHTFTSPQLGTNAQIAAGGEDQPSKTTFTFRAPTSAGSYEWLCVVPCDPWAMSHYGFMKGYVTVT